MLDGQPNLLAKIGAPLPGPKFEIDVSRGMWPGPDRLKEGNPIGFLAIPGATLLLGANGGNCRKRALLEEALDGRKTIWILSQGVESPFDQAGTGFTSLGPSFEGERYIFTSINMDGGT